ncbi:helix-turn-helix domain-containing protein [Roseibium salinum]|nr:helix-turn-helix domain-containing protein [Roseibium salinum]
MATPRNNSIVKGFDILALITPERAEISARTVVAELDMNLATAHRLLTTLAAVGGGAGVLQARHLLPRSAHRGTRARGAGDKSLVGGRPADHRKREP